MTRGSRSPVSRISLGYGSVTFILRMAFDFVNYENVLWTRGGGPKNMESSAFSLALSLHQVLFAFCNKIRRRHKLVTTFIRYNPPVAQARISVRLPHLGGG
jgi:hypothetical protein